MIRRDYILRMIEEFIQALSRINSLKRAQQWQEASGIVGEEFRRLVETDAASAIRLSDTELLALLIRGEPTLAVREKTLILTTLFKEAGDLATAQDRSDQGRSLYLKSLHLLLEVLSRETPFDCPDFVPRVEALISVVENPLPIETLARLMQYYECLGEFGKAEDRLFAMLEAEPPNPGLVEFGIAFYQRLQSHSDSALAAGNLPRDELEAGLLELRNKLKIAAPQQ